MVQEKHLTLENETDLCRGFDNKIPISTAHTSHKQRTSFTQGQEPKT
jgi:hypothetical protein